MSAKNRIILAPTRPDMKAGNILVTIKHQDTSDQKSIIIEAKNPELVSPRTLIPAVLPAWEVVKVVYLTSANTIKNKTK